MNSKTMSTYELKEAISLDIETLKSLEVDIMPAKEYYRLNAQLFCYVFLKIYSTILLGFILPILFHWQEIARTPIIELMSALGFMALLAFGLCTFAFVFIYSAINHYILIKYQLKDKLRTGDLIVRQIRLAGMIAYRIFAAVVLIPSIFLFPGCALFLAIGGFFISGILTNIIVEMELNRIGISTLFVLVRRYFDKDKKASADLTQTK